MIPCNMRTVEVVSFEPGVDDYGQPRQIESIRRNSEVAIWYYTKNMVQDPRYSDVEYIGLTNDDDITDENIIAVDGKEYIILFIIPSKRYNQLFMKIK